MKHCLVLMIVALSASLQAQTFFNPSTQFKFGTLNVQEVLLTDPADLKRFKYYNFQDVVQDVQKYQTLSFELATGLTLSDGNTIGTDVLRTLFSEGDGISIENGVITNTAPANPDDELITDFNNDNGTLTVVDDGRAWSLTLSSFLEGGNDNSLQIRNNKFFVPSVASTVAYAREKWDVTAVSAMHTTTTSFPVDPNAYELYRNGKLLTINDDYTRTGDIYTFVIPAQTGEKFTWKTTIF